MRLPVVWCPQGPGQRCWNSRITLQFLDVGRPQENSLRFQINRAHPTRCVLVADARRSGRRALVTHHGGKGLRHNRPPSARPPPAKLGRAIRAVPRCGVSSCLLPAYPAGRNSASVRHSPQTPVPIASSWSLLAAGITRTGPLHRAVPRQPIGVDRRLESCYVDADQVRPQHPCAHCFA